MGDPVDAPPSSPETPSYCRNCDYPLIGLAAQAACPECGWAFDLAQPGTFRQGPGKWQRVVRRWLGRAAVVTLVLGLLSGAGLAWLWHGWRGEQAVVQRVEAWHGSVGYKPRYDNGLFRIPPGLRVDAIDIPDAMPSAEVEKLDFKSLSRLKCIFCYDRPQRVALSDAALMNLAEAPTLEVLILNWSPVTDAAVAKFATLPNLWFLDIKGSQITDAGLIHVGKMKRLRRLDLRYVEHITDKGLENLTGLTELELLGIRPAPPALTQAGIDKLTAALPKLRPGREW